MADRAHGTSTPPTESSVDREDWYGRDLDGETFERVAFGDCDFSEITTTGATFTECTFRNVRFNASTHTDSAF
ncbi:MAG: pentapeptide repeat-containing protein, partial [Oerskovia sp.]|nr:pentapeptide repeat-containing protein [Oerskovia sp.]